MVSGMYPKWLEEVLIHDKSGMMKEVIACQARWFYFVKEIRGFDRFNRELELIEPKSYSNVALIGLLRGTSSLKFCLPYWEVLKMRVCRELVSRGEDAEKILSGL